MKKKIRYKKGLRKHKHKENFLQMMIYSSLANNELIIAKKPPQNIATLIRNVPKEIISEISII